MRQSKDTSVPSSVLLQLLAEGEFVSLLPGGTSMLPFIHPHTDRVTLSGRKTPALHDVIFYRRADGSLVLHRIIRIEQGNFICTGDNQYWPETVKPEQILATLTGLVRRGKQIPLTGPLYAIYCNVRLPLRRFRKYCVTGLQSKWKGRNTNGS